jgi:hypothetical protein
MSRGCLQLLYLVCLLRLCASSAAEQWLHGILQENSLHISKAVAVLHAIIIIINPCKPYHFGIGTAPSGEVESRLIAACYVTPLPAEISAVYALLLFVAAAARCCNMIPKEPGTQKLLTDSADIHQFSTPHTSSRQVALSCLRHGQTVDM